MNKAFTNIHNIQKQVQQTINDLISENGYSLVKEEKFVDSQALLLQWSNHKSKHTFQLIWDIKEHWFDLGEFNRVNDLNYSDSKNIELFPYAVIRMFFRNKYNAKYLAKIKLKIQEKLNVL